MAFTATPDETAAHEVAAMYEADREALGYVANYTRPSRTGPTSTPRGARS